uniref:Reverse transcriptase n=1 Tax=Strongyloides venezuelensis TaxID=75913 RepID=A0A0K0EVQ7_STRVS
MLSSTKKARVARYLELYVIKKALIFFALLVFQEEMVAYSDYKPSKEVLEHNVGPRYADLINAISLYSIKIHYINGKSNSLLDLLSRIFAYESLKSHHLTVSTNNSKSQLLKQELFKEHYKKLLHICYSNMKDVAERAIRTRHLLLKKDESKFGEGNSFQRRVAIVTRNYNRIEHSSTDKRPRDLIFAFSIHSILRDSEDVKLKNLKIATL